MSTSSAFETNRDLLLHRLPIVFIVMEGLKDEIISATSSDEVLHLCILYCLFLQEKIHPDVKFMSNHCDMDWELTPFSVIYDWIEALHKFHVLKNAAALLRGLTQLSGQLSFITAELVEDDADETTSPLTDARAHPSNPPALIPQPDKGKACKVVPVVPASSVGDPMDAVDAFNDDGIIIQDPSVSSPCSF